MLLLAILNISLLEKLTTAVNVVAPIVKTPTVNTIEASTGQKNQTIATLNPDYQSKIDFKQIDTLKLEITKPIVKETVKKPTVLATVIANPAPKNNFTPNSISIARINLTDLKLAQSSVGRANELYSKMLYSPVLEDTISPDLCSDAGNSYITGHSQPTSKKESNYPAVNIFSNLNTLQVGDTIQATNGSGINCSYKVTKWDKLVTNSDDTVSEEIFKSAYFPKTDKPTLTIQTCQKNSTTVRLLLRAEKI